MIVLSIVGSSGSGKTKLIEKLVPELLKLGFKVAVIKHAHKEFDFEEKDSTRIFRSGAEVAVVSNEKFAIIRRGNLKDVLEFFKDYDIVLTEGFSKEGYPKIALDDRKYENVVFRYDGNLDSLINFILSALKAEGKKFI
uniref:Molybdopterin-guanine dinucleotide biosynthesis protein B n=1 Tax=Archaeoglobus fulgidus TaxID=2234 RepID=A0A7J2TGM1_ARCFL